ncbi:MAG TPA: hypothetical protein VEZ15_06220 [Acidimicrobiia bacterium]|nr:hypothetical protein [Acidimicrobiia bacterium]
MRSARLPVNGNDPCAADEGEVAAGPAVVVVFASVEPSVTTAVVDVVVRGGLATLVDVVDVDSVEPCVSTVEVVVAVDGTVVLPLTSNVVDVVLVDVVDVLVLGRVEPCVSTVVEVVLVVVVVLPVAHSPTQKTLCLKRWSPASVWTSSFRWKVASSLS